MCYDHYLLNNVQQQHMCVGCCNYNGVVLKKKVPLVQPHHLALIIVMYHHILLHLMIADVIPPLKKIIADVIPPLKKMILYWR